MRGCAGAETREKLPPTIANPVKLANYDDATRPSRRSHLLEKKAQIFGLTSSQYFRVSGGLFEC